jgi:sortase A
LSNLGGGIAVARRDRSRRLPATRRRRSFIQIAAQVIGELLITAGLILLLFVAWQLWWTNVESNAKQDQAVEEFYADLGEIPAPAAPEDSPPPPDADADQIPVLETKAEGETFAVMYIPRFGDDYTRPVTTGVTTAVLDNLGLGHYPETGMPGAVGNFALAGHRIYVHTQDGYYTYVFRNTQIVLPDRVDVLAPVPTQPGVEPEERLLTLTSCNPRFGAQERIIAYALMESFRPLDNGPPDEIAAQVAGVAEGAA